jgi:hypothetical protein
LRKGNEAEIKKPSIFGIHFYFMKYSLFILLIICSMCTSKKQSPGEAFEGNFKGTNNGITATANLTVSDGRLQGTVLMNGESARLDGSIDGESTRGTLHDAATDKDYDYTGSIAGDELSISIIFPELNDQEVKLIMQREGGSEVKEKAGKQSGELNPDLVGTWKHTEILGGGGGESMTNEFLMEFREDGTCSSWPGRSTGFGSYQEEDKSKATNGKWYTAGDMLHFVDPATGEDASTNYSVSESGLLMSNGGSKKIWQRVY